MNSRVAKAESCNAGDPTWGLSCHVIRILAFAGGNLPVRLGAGTSLQGKILPLGYKAEAYLSGSKGSSARMDLETRIKTIGLRLLHFLNLRQAGKLVA